MVKLSDTRSWLKHLPNKLTLGRMGAIPVLLLIYPFNDKLGALRIVSAVLFAIAAMTDLLDGYVARKYGNVTPLGALLDQVADKMLVAASLVLLANSAVIPAFVAGLLICRDIAVNGIRLLANEQNMTIEVNDFGKWKTTLLSMSIFCLFINEPLLGIPMREIGMVTLWGGLGLSLYSAWTYGHGFLQKAKISL